MSKNIGTVERWVRLVGGDLLILVGVSLQGWVGWVSGVAGLALVLTSAGGGRLRIIATAVQDPVVVRRILAHLGLAKSPAPAPPTVPPGALPVPRTHSVTLRPSPAHDRRDRARDPATEDALRHRAMLVCIGRTHAVPSAPSPRDTGGRHAASRAGPSLTPGIARVTGAKASVSTAIAL